jgi:hypothetical protein
MPNGSLKKKAKTRSPESAKKYAARVAALAKQRAKAQAYSPSPEIKKGLEKQTAVLRESYRAMPETSPRKMELFTRQDVLGPPGEAEARIGGGGHRKQRILKSEMLKAKSQQEIISKAGVKAAKKGVRVKAPKVAKQIAKQKGFKKHVMREGALKRLGRIAGRLGKLGVAGTILEGVKFGMEQAERKKRGGYQRL